MGARQPLQRRAWQLVPAVEQRRRAIVAAAQDWQRPFLVTVAVVVVLLVFAAVLAVAAWPARMPWVLVRLLVHLAVEVALETRPAVQRAQAPVSVARQAQPWEAEV